MQQDKGRSRDWTKSCAYKQYMQQQSAAQSLLAYLAPQVLSLLAVLVQKVLNLLALLVQKYKY